MPSEDKKHYFKKEKKILRLKRHKAPSQKTKKVLKPIKVEETSRISFFPKNFRFITEQKVWLAVLLALTLATLAIMTPQLVSSWNARQHAQQEYQKLQKDLKTWEAIIQRYPTYRDAYFEAAVLSYRLGDKEKEVLLLTKLQTIDPNFALAQQLEKISGVGK